MAVEVFYKNIVFPIWAASLSVAENDIVAYSAYFYRVTVAGDLGSSPPSSSFSPQTNGTATLERVESSFWVNVGTVTADSKCNLYIVNKTNSSGNFKLAIHQGTRGDEHYIFHDFSIKSNGTFILTDVLMLAGETLSIDCPQNFNVRLEAGGV